MTDAIWIMDFIAYWLAFNAALFLGFGITVYLAVKKDKEEALKELFREPRKKTFFDKIMNPITWAVCFPVLFPLYAIDLLRNKYEWMNEDLPIE